MSPERLVIEHIPTLQPLHGSHQDVEHEIGALASRHGLSLDQARGIIERCGADLDCIDAEAKKLAQTAH